MKTLGNNLVETFELYGENQIPLNIFLDITRAVFNEDSVVFTLENVLPNLNREEASEEYSALVGGGFYLVEDKDDLRLIPTSIADSQGKRWLTLNEIPDSFDICKFLEDSPKTVVICDIWSDAGGDTYYIPESSITKNVLDSIELTKQFWADAKENMNANYKD